jgi:hypothetical protein
LGNSILKLDVFYDALKVICNRTKTFFGDIGKFGDIGLAIYEALPVLKEKFFIVKIYRKLSLLRLSQHAS